MLSVYNIDLLKNTFNRTLKFGHNKKMQFTFILWIWPIVSSEVLVRISLDFKSDQIQIRNSESLVLLVYQWFILNSAENT